ncbi:acriflavin resistance protein [Anopheles sinensis]|uniref:Acriflavin resistance protein n=1 Tax=Anopheles sinensis TaxID=74873 RepID=A0A084WUL1_ANOSI|nr:acriflavin resistance protein [Anopheles sinensis]
MAAGSRVSHWKDAARLSVRRKQGWRRTPGLGVLLCFVHRITHTIIGQTNKFPNGPEDPKVGGKLTYDSGFYFTAFYGCEQRIPTSSEYLAHVFGKARP